MNSQRLEHAVQKQSLDMELFAEELQNFFEDVVKLNENRIHFDVDVNQNIITDKQILKIVLRNLIDNSNKYTKKGQINVTGERENNKYVFKIKDTGKGMTQKEIDRLMNFQEDESITTTKGLGYMIINDLTALIGAKIKIDSVLQKGTTVYVEIPVG